MCRCAGCARCAATPDVHSSAPGVGEAGDDGAQLLPAPTAAWHSWPEAAALSQMCSARPSCALRVFPEREGVKSIAPPSTRQSPPSVQ